MKSRRRFALSIALTALLAGGLAACVPEPTNNSQDSKSNSSSKPLNPAPQSSSSTAPSPNPSESSQKPVTLTAEKVGTTCEAIFPLARLYDIDPNLALTPGQSNIESPVVGQQRNLGGLFCDLVHLSSGDVVQYGFVRLTSSSAEAQRALISSQSAGGAFQVTSSLSGTFSAPSGQFIDGAVWVTVSSPTFSAPVDASLWANLASRGLPR